MREYSTKSYIQSMNSENMKFKENNYSMFHWTNIHNLPDVMFSSEDWGICEGNSLTFETATDIRNERN